MLPTVWVCAFLYMTQGYCNPVGTVDGETMDRRHTSEGNETRYGDEKAQFKAAHTDIPSEDTKTDPLSPGMENNLSHSYFILVAMMVICGLVVIGLAGTVTIAVARWRLSPAVLLRETDEAAAVGQKAKQNHSNNTDMNRQQWRDSEQRDNEEGSVTASDDTDSSLWQNCAVGVETVSVSSHTFDGVSESWEGDSQTLHDSPRLSNYQHATVQRSFINQSGTTKIPRPTRKITFVTSSI